MTGVEIVSALVLILFLVAVITLCVYDLTGVNIIKRAWDNICNAATWRPRTGIDKEIAEEEKEIAELERQKEKIDELAELKRRKERLFNEVNPDCKWCGEDDCLQSAYAVDGVAQYYCTSCHKWLHDGSSMA